MRKITFLIFFISSIAQAQDYGSLYYKYKNSKNYFLCYQELKNYFWDINDSNNDVSKITELISLYNDFIEIKSENIKDTNSIFLDKSFSKSFFLPHLYTKRGYYKATMEDFKGAIMDYNKSLILSQYGQETTFLNRGIAKLHINDPTGCDDLRTAGENGRNEAYPFIKQYCN